MKINNTTKACNTTQTVCMLVQPKQSQSLYSRRVRLVKEELRYVDKFCYIGHVITADVKMIKIMKKNSKGKMQLAT